MEKEKEYDVYYGMHYYCTRTSTDPTIVANNIYDDIKNYIGEYFNPEFIKVTEKVKKQS